MRTWVWEHRWRILGAWIIVFTILVFWGQRTNRSAISEIKKQKASILGLQRTNCGLREFLLAAKRARDESATHETGQAKKQDLQAAAGYGRLARNFTRDECDKILNTLKHVRNREHS